MSGQVILAMNRRLPTNAWYFILLHLVSSGSLLHSKDAEFVGSESFLYSSDCVEYCWCVDSIRWVCISITELLSHFNSIPNMRSGIPLLSNSTVTSTSVSTMFNLSSQVPMARRSSTWVLMIMSCDSEW